MSKWSFCICSGGGEESRDRIDKILSSIWNQNIPDDNYEILIIGPDKLKAHNLKHIKFDESVKKAWITKKKNDLARFAKFQNLCVMHDYVILKNDWYNGFQKFGYNWSHCMNPIANMDGIRFRDWVTWLTPPGSPPTADTIRFLEYDDHSMTNQQYISGTYYCVKKDWALKYPLDERKVWGQSEDVHWSYECRDFWDYKCNPHSLVQFIKQKPHHPISPMVLCNPYKG